MRPTTVDLPDPDSPTRATVLPQGTVRLKLRNTLTSAGGKTTSGQNNRSYNQEQE
jgi:hypothetical protein